MVKMPMFGNGKCCKVCMQSDFSFTGCILVCSVFSFSLYSGCGIGHRLGKLDILASGAVVSGHRLGKLYRSLDAFTIAYGWGINIASRDIIGHIMFSVEKGPHH